MDYLSHFKAVQRDDEYKKLAVNNIVKHPIKYFRNCVANICRLLIDTPYYFAFPTDMYLFRVLPMLFLFPFIILSMSITAFNFKRTPFELKILFLLTILYFMLTIIVSAYNRQFYIMIPIFLLFIAYTFERSVKFKLKI